MVEFRVQPAASKFRRARAVLAAIGLASALSPAGASALDGAEFAEPHLRPRPVHAAHRTPPDTTRAARPLTYEDEVGTGGLHTAGDVWVHVDNTNYSPGNYWYNLGLNQDPGAEWPGPSGIEYLQFASLWVAGRDASGGRHVSEGDEIRGELDPVSHTRRSYEGYPGGLRGVDDDGDGRIDEEYQNGLDDDADGKIDEDFAAISSDMFSTEMTDYTPEAQQDPTNTDLHVPMGIRVRRSSMAWSAPGQRDFVGFHYEITNVTRQAFGAPSELDSIYVGMYWRPTCGPRVGGIGNDDQPGMSILAEAGGAALQPNRTYHSSPDEKNLNVFWCADDDGDGGATPGAGAVVLLGATRFPRLGMKRLLKASDLYLDAMGNAPRTIGPYAYRIFDPVLPFAQGGRPVTDAQRWIAMTDSTQTTRVFPDKSSAGSYRTMFSVGPFVELDPDSTIELDVAMCVGRANYTSGVGPPRVASDYNAFQLKFGSGVPGDPLAADQQTLLGACQAAWQAWRGYWQTNPGYDALTRYLYPHTGNNSCQRPYCDANYTFVQPVGDRGREACVLAPPGTLPEALSYWDCHDICPEDQTLSPRFLSPDRCTWFDLDCDLSTGGCPAFCDSSLGRCYRLRPAVDHITWYAAASPLQPRVSLLSGNHQVEIQWDDLAEHGGGAQVQGYRLYRASGWQRDPTTGVIGPSNDLWQLVRTWWVGGSTGDSVGAIRNPAVGDSTFDAAAPCPRRGCRVHPVGYYHYVDPKVVNGFRYFYTVTAFNESSQPGGAPGATIVTQSPLSAVESTVVVPHVDCEGDVAHIRVVPNPYRFKAAWDLRPSSADPTGTHLNFNHLPCGRFTLQIFTVAGDLVQTFHESDTHGTGTLEWNLVSRNGQDVRGGIYLYAIDSGRGHAVGRFTVIR